MFDIRCEGLKAEKSRNKSAKTNDRAHQVYLVTNKRTHPRSLQSKFRKENELGVKLSKTEGNEGNVEYLEGSLHLRSSRLRT